MCLLKRVKTNQNILNVLTVVNFIAVVVLGVAVWLNGKSQDEISRKLDLLIFMNPQYIELQKDLGNTEQGVADSDLARERTFRNSPNGDKLKKRYDDMIDELAGGK